MSLNLGSKAPNFTLRNTEDEKVTLSDFQGKKKVVLLFFPLAFSSTCTEELCKTRDNMKFYNSMDAKVLGISVDSFFVLREFKRTQNLNFTLLSDFNREISDKYEVLYEDYHGMKGVAKRASFVIDHHGIIKHREVLEDADLLPDFKSIQLTLSKLS